MNKDAPGKIDLLPPDGKDNESLIEDQRKLMYELIENSTCAIVFTCDTEGKTRATSFGDLHMMAELLILGNITIERGMVETLTVKDEAAGETKQ